MQISGLENLLQEAGSVPSDTLEGHRQELWPCRVLVVDDDELVRASLSTLLQRRQFDVETAASAKEALLIMAAIPCQILLTDWQMPDMDGLSLCQHVRAEGPDRHVYVLMHTVRDGDDAVLAGLAAGADDYVVKGAPIEELLARLEVGRGITSRPACKRGHDEKWRASSTNTLTESRSLHYLMRNLARELARSRRYGHRLAVLRCAVDEFTQINDRLGSEAGEDVLRAVVGRAKSCLRRGNDWLARVETNEFMIVLPQANLNCAHRVAQTMRQPLVRDVAATGAATIGFTLSIGVTAIESKHGYKDFPKPDDLLQAAERGMQASKRRGGNRVTAAAVSSSITIDIGSLLEGNNAVH